MAHVDIAGDVEASIKLHTAISKKSGKEYTAVAVQVGRWRALVFPKSSFEMDYLKEQLEG